MSRGRAVRKRPSGSLKHAKKEATPRSPIVPDVPLTIPRSVPPPRVLLHDYPSFSMSTKGKVSLAVVVGGAFLAGILFATAGANLFGFGDAIGTSGQAAELDGSTAIQQPVSSTPRKFETAFTKVAESVNPAVIQIRAAKVVERRFPNPFEGTPFERFFGQPPSQPEVRQGLGSGVIIRSDGHIVTNNHVIEGAEQLSVRLSTARNTRPRSWARIRSATSPC